MNTRCPLMLILFSRCTDIAINFTFIISKIYKSLKISYKVFLILFWTPSNIHFRYKSHKTETEKGRIEVRPVMKCMFDCVVSQLITHGSMTL